MSKTVPLILVGVCGVFSAAAQDVADDSSHLDSVIVTANKVAQIQQSTGKVISAIPKELIERNIGRSLGQLLNQQAGITINGALNNAGARQSVFMRGASEGRALILLDGIPLYDPSMINNEFDLNLLSLNNVERIEICRGAQSTIHGSDAVAGVINIISVKPGELKPVQLSASASAGSYGTYRGAVDISGKKQKLTYSAKYSTIRSNGFSAAADSVGDQHFDKDDFKGGMFSSYIKYQLTTAVELKAYLHAARNRTALDAAAFRDEKDYVSKSNSLITGIGTSYSQNNLSLVFNYQYSTGTRFFTNDSTHTPGSEKFSSLEYRSTAYFIEAYSKVALGRSFSLMQGVDYRRSSMNSSLYSLSSFGAFTNEFRDTSHNLASLYASVFYHAFEKRLNIDLGGRWSIHSQYGRNATFSFNPSYALTKHYRVMGSIASAFKAPTLFQLYSAYGETTLKPEKSTTLEAGVEQRHGKTSNRIVVFRRKISGGIDFNYINYKYYNVNEQVVRGIEYEGAIAHGEHFSATLNYTYLRPEESSQSRTTFKDTVYHYLLRRPAHTVNLHLGYAFDNGIYIKVGSKYVSRRFDVGAYQQEDIRLEDYLLVEAYGEYKVNKSLTMFADFQNITNTEFFDINGYNSIPFIFNAGMRFRL